MKARDGYRMTRRRAVLAIAAVTTFGLAPSEELPAPTHHWTDWNEAAGDMARFELASRMNVGRFDTAARSIRWNDRGVRLAYRFVASQAEHGGSRQAALLRQAGSRVLGCGVACGRHGETWCVFYL